MADPQLAPLAAEDGIEIMRPAATSPAAALGTGCPPDDQLGHARPSPCTAGAVELSAP